MGSRSNCGSGKTGRGRFRLRPFVFQDLDRILEIEANCFETQAFSKSQFEEIYGEHPGAFYVAESSPAFPLPERREGAGRYSRSGEVMGYILGTVTGERGGLRSLAVDPHFRNLGVGRALITGLLKRFRKMGIRVCSLKVRTDNEPAIRLYKKTGFEAIKILDSKGEGDVEAYLMSIDI